jgi:hypothetical protein
MGLNLSNCQIAKELGMNEDEDDAHAMATSMSGFRYGATNIVCHARGEYARDEDGDGHCEVSTLWRGSGPS